jgi:hypothetical protein
MSRAEMWRRLIDGTQLVLSLAMLYVTVDAWRYGMFSGLLASTLTGMTLLLVWAIRWDDRRGEG